MTRDEYTFLGIIPARYASSRLPGKPLAEINGKSMICRVYERASQVFENLYVATDDSRIFNEVKGFGGDVVMTSNHHESGSDRCLEASELIEKETGTKMDVVVNIQGDEPFISPESLLQLKSCFDDPGCRMATLAFEQSEPVNADPSGVYLVKDEQYNALYFSRARIPVVRNPDKKTEIYLKHIGLYAYTADALREFSEAGTSSLERKERLEQLRRLEMGHKIKVAVVDEPSISVDTEDDLEKARKIARGN